MFRTILTKFLCLTLLNFVSCQVATKFTDGTNVPGVCLCGTSGQCGLAGGGGANDGSGVINPRVLNTGGVSRNVGTNISMCQPVTTGVKLTAVDQSSCGDGLEMCCPDVGYTCGVSYPPISAAPQAMPDQALYGAYPYTVAIYSADNKYLGGGALIDEWNVLTAAHIIVNVPTPLTIKIGYWDLSASQEPLERITLSSSSIMIHPNFTAKNLKNDIAIIKLPKEVPLGQLPTIGSVCLPSALPKSGIRCMLSGWGGQTVSAPSNILKHVDLPLIDSSDCQSMLRTTNLNKTFVFDSKSFICAGGEKGKDSCTGDGGSPLSCYVVDRYYLVGVVSWGIGCGQPGIPGVYTNIFNYIPWIQKTTAQLQNGNPSSPPSLPPRPTTTAGSVATTSSTTTTVDGKVTKSASPVTDPTVATTKTSTTTEKTIPTTTSTTIKTTATTPGSSGTTIKSNGTVSSTTGPVSNNSTATTTSLAKNGTTIATSTTTKPPGTTNSTTRASNGTTTTLKPATNATGSTKTASSGTTTSTKPAGTTSTSKSASNGPATSTTVQGSSNGSSRRSSSTHSTTKAGSSSSLGSTTVNPSNATKPANGTTVKSGPTTTTKPEQTTTKPDGSSTRRRQSTRTGTTVRSGQTTPRRSTTTLQKGTSKPANVTVKGQPRRRSTSTTKKPSL